MTATLAKAARKIEVPPTPGLSRHAIRHVLASMAQIAQADGTFRYGLRGSKVAELADLSLSLIRRAQRWLVEHGYLEKLEVGGGRKSTRWRVILDRLLEHLPRPRSGHATEPPVARPPSSPDTAQRRPLEGRERFFPWSRRNVPSPRVAPTYEPPIEVVCEEHGSTGGVLPGGLPRCPGCRRILGKLHDGRLTTEVRQ
jgi:hypothetical protein